MTNCPQCDGLGSYEYYPDTRPRETYDEKLILMDPCDECVGSGEVEGE